MVSLKEILKKDSEVPKNEIKTNYWTWHKQNNNIKKKMKMKWKICTDTVY